MVAERGAEPRADFTTSTSAKRETPKVSVQGVAEQKVDCKTEQTALKGMCYSESTMTQSSSTLVSAR